MTVIENLSVCMIVRNEAANLPRVLDSLRGWAGQIIVFDCGSVDDSARIATAAGADVHDVPNDIPEVSRNRSFEIANREWIFIVDADEVIPDKLWREIAAVVGRAPRENGFKIPRRNFYFGAPLMHGGNYPDRQLRLFRRGRGRYPLGVFHESIAVDGEVGSITSSFDHHPYPTFAEWMRKLDFYTDYGARKLAHDGVPITSSTIRHHMITRPMRRWLERLFVKRGVRDGVAGILAATSDFVTHVVSFGKYWHQHQGDDGGDPDVDR